MGKRQGRPRKAGNLLKRALSQRKRRATEKLAGLLNSGITDTPGQKELVAPSDAGVKNEPLHNVYQDTGLSTSLGTNTIQELSSSANNSSLNTEHQYNQSFMNKDVKYIHTSSVTVTAFDSLGSEQTVSYNNSYASPIAPNINVFPNTTAKEKPQSVYNCNATQTANLKPAPEQVLGRRIIDLEYFFNALKSMNKHSLSGCNLNDIIITNERKNGLHASYRLKCTVCEFEQTLWTECPNKFKNINTDTVAGMLSINCNFWVMNKLLLKMDLPRLTRGVFVRERDKICSDEVTGGINLTNQGLKFPKIDDKPAKECEKFSESSPQIESCQASTSPNKRMYKISKTNSKFVTQKQKSEPLKNLISVSFHKNKSYHQVKKRSLIEDKSKQKSRPLKSQISASLHKNKSYQQVNLNRLLIEDEFQIERSHANCESEPELILPHDIKEVKTSTDNLVIGTEQATFDITRINKEINSNVYYDKLTRLKSNEMEILNNDSFLGCVEADTSKGMLSQQENVRSCEDKIIVDKKNKLNYIEL